MGGLLHVVLVDQDFDQQELECLRVKRNNVFYLIDLSDLDESWDDLLKIELFKIFFPEDFQETYPLRQLLGTDQKIQVLLDTFSLDLVENFEQLEKILQNSWWNLDPRAEGKLLVILRS